MATLINTNHTDISQSSTVHMEGFHFEVRNPNFQNSGRKIPKIQPVIHETKDHKTIEVGPLPGEEFAP